MNEKDKLPKTLGRETKSPGTARLGPAGSGEAWRGFGIMAEFVEATERPAAGRPGAAAFGTARDARAAEDRPGGPPRRRALGRLDELCHNAEHRPGLA